MNTKVLALVGVSGSGKTTLADALQKELGENKVEILPEATKAEICNFYNLPLLDFQKASRRQMQQFDHARVYLQMQREVNAIVKCNKEILVIDKSALQALMYLLVLSGRDTPDGEAEESRRDVTYHADHHYHYTVHMPFCEHIGVDSLLERNFRNQSKLTLQDAALEEVMSWLEVPCEINTNCFIDENVNIIKLMVGQECHL